MKIIAKFIRGVFSILKFAIGAAIGIFLVALIFPEYFPLGTPSKKLTDFKPSPILDMHVHVAGFGYGASGCFVSKELGSGYKSFFYLQAFGVRESELKKFGDELLVQRLSDKIAESKFTSKAVILAMDAVYDKQGNIKTNVTQVYVPNEYVRKQSKKYDNLIYGASINPYRKDAIEKLQKVKDDGAVLIKWIPNIMHIDPADPTLIPFYKEMVRLNIPLLTHAGQERSFASAIDKYGDPLRLKLPLEIGVKVIAAHIATTGKIGDEEMIDRLLPMIEKYPNLFVDISSLTQINKLSYLAKGLLNKKIRPTMLYGSDWPLQFFPLVTPWLFIDRLSLADIQYIASQDNVFDRDILLKRALGTPSIIFEETGKFFGVELN